MTEDTDSRMIALWEKGLPASQIAKTLGLTRNAVAGKLHRFKFSGKISQQNAIQRLDAIRSNTHQLEKERLTILNAQSNPKLSLYKIEDKLISLPKVTTDPVDDPINMMICEEVTAPVGKPVKFDKLTARSCRFIINDGPPQDFLFCGKEKTGRSYCAEHSKLCHYTLARANKNADNSQSS